MGLSLTNITKQLKSPFFYVAAKQWYSNSKIENSLG